MKTTPKTATLRRFRRFGKTPSPTPQTHYSNGKLLLKGMRVFFISKSVVFPSRRGYHTRKASSLSGLSRNRGLSTSTCTSESSLSTQGQQRSSVSPLVSVLVAALVSTASVCSSATASKVLLWCPCLSRRPQLTRNQGLSLSESPLVATLVSPLCKGSTSLGNNSSFNEGSAYRVAAAGGRYLTARSLSVLYRGIEQLLEGAERPASPVLFIQERLLRCQPEKLLRRRCLRPTALAELFVPTVVSDGCFSKIPKGAGA